MTKPIRDKSNTDAGVEALEGKYLSQTQTKPDAVKKLVRAHQDLDPAMTAWWASANGEIQLIEVTPSVADTDEIVSLRFTSHEDYDIAYDLRMAILNPAEWSRLQQGKLKLPRGWESVAKFEAVQL